MHSSGRWTPNRPRRAILCGLPLVLLAAALPSAAMANIVTSTDRGRVKAKGLTSKERRALDIDTVTAIGSPAGLMVAVDLKGDTEQRLGRGHLKRAIVAIVLQPKSRSARPSVLATRGRGPVGQTLRVTRTADVAVTRDGDRLVFSILGGGLESVRRVEVRTFARARVRGATMAQPGPDLFGGNARPVDVDALSAPDPGTDACAAIRAKLAEKQAELVRVDEDLGEALQERLGLEDFIFLLEEDLRDEEAKDTPDPSEIRRIDEQIAKAQRRLTATEERERALYALKERVQSQLNEILEKQRMVCDSGGTLEIFGQDHGAMGFGNVCVTVDTDLTDGSATLTLDGPNGSVQEPITKTVTLDANGEAPAIFRVFDPNATYTVSGSATGDQGTLDFQPVSLNFTNVNAQGRLCGPA